MNDQALDAQIDALLSRIDTDFTTFETYEDEELAIELLKRAREFIAFSEPYFFGLYQMEKTTPGILAKLETLGKVEIMLADIRAAAAE